MTVDELIGINPNLGKVARFMKDNPSIPVRFWDNGTVDIMLGENDPIPSFIGKFKCPSCNEPTAGPEMPAGSDTIKGTFRECAACGIRFFIHNRVKFGGTT